MVHGQHYKLILILLQAKVEGYLPSFTSHSPHHESLEAYALSQAVRAKGMTVSDHRPPANIHTLPCG